MQAAERMVPHEMERAIELLMSSTGKVATIGSGKSGIAARKIAGTLTSTGTAAVFLHPVDALHGDLGIVNSQDVAIAVSNSGETDEMLAILRQLRKRRVPLISIVGNPRSTLAQASDAVLDASVDREAGSFSWAPTSSTAVAMAIGDSLALILMKAKSFTLEDFASNHPGGWLGKRLTLTVGDLMHTGSRNPTIPATAPWAEVIRQITAGGLGAISVVDLAGCLIGLITDGDVRRSVQDPVNQLQHLSASDFMTKDPIVTSPETLAYDALRMMEDRPSQIAVLPVIDEAGCAIGLVRIHDIIQAGLK